METMVSRPRASEIEAFVRNRYFYGKLLDVFHFESEQRYFNHKRWLLNRYGFGYGVLCGLDVKLSADGKSVRIEPGIAIDKGGREIIVPTRSAPVPIPQSPRTDAKGDHCDRVWRKVLICYHECLSDPEPVRVAGCDEPDPCMPGLIRESYEVRVVEGRAPRPDLDPELPDVCASGRIDYDALVRFVTARCRAVPDDTCIALANIRLPYTGDKCEPNDIDITIRPIVYTNDLLFELLLACCASDEHRHPGGKY